eukprot:5946951-Alexandrium_andersonii.AAC.1
MSASLVGSEMCIRDSFPLMARGPDARFGRSWASGWSGARAGALLACAMEVPKCATRFVFLRSPR